MTPLSAIRASNTAAFASLNSPVGIFVGGTSGIGRAMAETFSRQTTNATLIIVGRNRAAAEEMFARLKTPAAGGSSSGAGAGSGLKTEFIECDATSTKNVQSVTDQIIAKHPRVNFLILSQGFLSMDGYTPTEDGIDKKLALNYYSRWKFIDGLVPALERAKSSEAGSGGQAKVLSVLGPGKGGAIDLDDLGLKKTYSTLNAALAAPTYTDLMMEKFASRHPSLTFIHEYPGFVATPMMKNSNSKLLNILSPVVMPLMSPFTTSPEACAEYMWHGVHSSTESGRAYRRGEKGQDIGMERYFGNDEWREKVWEHSQKAASGGLQSET